MPPARPSDDARRRAAIVAAGRRLGARGLISAGEGNLSLRLGPALLITPSGRRKDELAPGDLVVVPLASAPRAGARTFRLQPSSDLSIHRAVSGSTAGSGTSPASVRAIAAGRWAWTTALTSGRPAYTARWIARSELAR